MQNCCLNSQRWLWLGSVLYMNWLNRFSVTNFFSMSWNACTTPSAVHQGSGLRALAVAAFVRIRAAAHMQRDDQVAMLWDTVGDIFRSIRPEPT